MALGNTAVSGGGKDDGVGTLLLDCGEAQEFPRENWPFRDIVVF